jgi:hypothetical protein
VSYLAFQVMCWATPRVMGSSQRGALRSPRSTWWSTTFPRERMFALPLYWPAAVFAFASLGTTPTIGRSRPKKILDVA